MEEKSVMISINFEGLLNKRPGRGGGGGGGESVPFEAVAHLQNCPQKIFKGGLGVYHLGQVKVKFGQAFWKTKK